VIIQNDRVVAAGCILPLTQDPRVASALGTRHRAALASLGRDRRDRDRGVGGDRDHRLRRGGKLHRKIDINTLRGDLLKSYGMIVEEKTPAAATT